MNQTNEFDDDEKRIRNDERLRIQRELNNHVRENHDDMSDAEKRGFMRAKRLMGEGRFNDVE